MVPPPGVGFVTVTFTAPATSKLADGTTAVNSVPDTYVVVKGVPFQFMTEVDMKSVPVAVIVNCAVSAVAEVGVIEVRVGIILSIVKICVFDIPPPGVGLNTVTSTVPAVARFEFETIAVSSVPDT